MPRFNSCYDLRGSHDRNCISVLLPGTGFMGPIEIDVVHEVDHGVYGKLSIGIIPSVISKTDMPYVIIWRPSRRHTTDLHNVPASGLHGTLEEAIADLPEANKKVQYLAKEERDRQTRRVKSKRPRDSQRTKVYRWERNDGLLTSLWKTISKTEVESFFNMVVEEEFKYGNKPTLSFRSGGRFSYGGIFGIRLLPCHHNKHVILHELAHTLVSHDVNKLVAHHGEEFMGMLVYLLVKYCNMDYSSLKKSVREANLKCEMPECYWRWINKQNEAKAA